MTLFAVTLLFTTAVGALHYLSYVSEFGRRPVELSIASLVDGLWYSLTLLGILGAHEFGHYYFCRRYNVDASLPYFIPAPIPLTGTLGAVIRIREAFPSRTALFDIGVAGPIAGFVVLVPALLIGMSLSSLVAVPSWPVCLLPRRTAALPVGRQPVLRPRCRTGRPSTSTRWCSPPGSGCWRRP